MQFRAWRQLSLKAKELADAREELKVRLAELAKDHQALDQETKDEETGGNKSDHAAAHPEKEEEHLAATPEASVKAPEKYSALKH